MAEPCPGSAAFPRARRLQQSRDFARLKVGGQRVVAGSLIFNWQPVVGGGAGRLGLVTSRKVGGAVVRNRSRRLMREVYRRNQASISLPVDMVLVARQSMAGQSYAGVERDFFQALRKARLLRESPAP
jgi:ribonuclease P protein component